MFFQKGVFSDVLKGVAQKNFPGGKPPDPHSFLASLAILPPQSYDPGYATAIYVTDFVDCNGILLKILTPFWEKI